jgi:hypothetical protein
MSFRQWRRYISFLTMVSACLLWALPALAQTGTGTLHGQVTDPSGAAIPGATITVTTPAGPVTSSTNEDGNFSVKGLAPGKYSVQASSTGFTTYKNDNVTIAAGQVQTLPISLEIEVQQQRVVVSTETPQVDVSPENNASAIIIKGEDLDALPDDPDELQADLEALAGPSAGPNGGQIYIDGFTAGELPPKSSIREIRINQNPFSAEYDKLGYGRIEIFTKPGTDQFHGQAEVSGNDSAFNSRNPFAGEEPSYDSVLYNGSVGGPLSKKASFFFSAQRRDINDIGVVSAVILDQNYNIVPYSASVPNPRTRTNISPRLDYQITKNNTLTVRYQYYRDNQMNDGVGPFALPSQAYNILSTEQTVQISDTQVLSSKVVNETRFQYIHDTTNQLPLSVEETVNVLGAFTGGGSNQGTNVDHTNHYELQNYTSMALGRHTLKFGARLRGINDDNSATPGFNGMFTFPSILAYQITEQGIAEGLTPAQIRAMGGGASQFSITAGTPAAQAGMFDAGLYIQDDWLIRKNLTLSAGLRFESQTDISNHADWAPRLAIAWGLGKKTVLRAGTGIFYDRFTDDLVLQQDRLNGVNQQEFVVTNPDFFPTIPPANTLPNALPTSYLVNPNLHAPGTLQTAVTMDRQISKIATMSVSYLNSRGFDQLLTNSINTPFPGTYNPLNPQSGVRPYGNVGNIYQYQSGAIFRQNELIANFTVRAGTRLSLFGYYALNYANSDTAGASSFPSNPYNLQQDYGRAAFDVRNRVFMGGTISLPHAFRISPFLVASSGHSYNVTIGQDLIGSSIFNQRPSFASPLSNPANVVVTSLGTFDTVPQPGETLVPINFGTGAPQFTLNLRVSKTFGFGKTLSKPGANGPGGSGGPGGGGGEGGHSAGAHGGGAGGFGGGGMMGGMGAATNHRYNLTFSVNARNVFNYVNLAPPVGVVGSPLFGQSNALAGGPFSSNSASRLISLQTSFSF